MFKGNVNALIAGLANGAHVQPVVGTMLPFIKKQTHISSDQIRSKFYVACTRAKHNIVIAMDTPRENDVFKATEFRFAGNVIPALKFKKI